MANRYSNAQGNRGDYGRDNWNTDINRGQQQFGRNDYQDEARHRGEHFVGRDFMNNQPRFERYGQMNDASGQYGNQFGNQYGNQYGQGRNRGNQGRNRGNQFSGQGRSNERWNRNTQYQASRFGGGNYAEPGRNLDQGYDRDFDNRDFGSIGRGYDQGHHDRDEFNTGSWDRGLGGRLRVDQYGEHRFDSGRTPFDESIAGRPYWGSDREETDFDRSGMSSGFHSGGSYGYDRDRFGRNRYDSRYDRLSGSDWYSGSSRYDQSDRDDRSMGDKVRDFFGIGPKGYKRSDDRIREEVSEALADHPEINASEIEIQVKDGEVTLTGNVTDRRQKRLAEDVAEDVRGVHDVHNQIRVSVRYGTGSNTGDSGTSKSISGSTTGSSSKKDKDQAA